MSAALLLDSCIDISIFTLIILLHHLLYQSSPGKKLWLTLAFSFSEWKWNCLCFTIVVHQANIVLHNRGSRLSQFRNSDHGTCKNWFLPFWRRAAPWLYWTLGLWWQFHFSEFLSCEFLHITVHICHKFLMEKWFLSIDSLCHVKDVFDSWKQFSKSQVELFTFGETKVVLCNMSHTLTCYHGRSLYVQLA